jgi:hypothetical protein
MTDPSTAATAQYNGEYMRAMAAQLAAHGLTTHLADFRAGLDLTAVKSGPPVGSVGRFLIIFLGVRAAGRRVRAWPGR